MHQPGLLLNGLPRLGQRLHVGSLPQLALQLRPHRLPDGRRTGVHPSGTAPAAAASAAVEGAAQRGGLLGAAVARGVGAGHARLLPLCQLGFQTGDFFLELAQHGVLQGGGRGNAGDRCAEP